MSKTTLIGASALLALLASGLALGDLIVEEAPTPPTILEHRPPGNYTLPPLKPDGTAVALDRKNVMLDRVSFVGNTVVSTGDLQSVAAPYLGKSIGADDIETLRQKVTLLYIERGYINSGAVLPANALDHGTLKLEIVEGSLKEIHLRGLNGLHERYVANRLVHDKEPLNMQTLGERFQLLLTDPLFTRMNGQLLPDIERGKAILNVDIERARPYQLSLSANNYRPVSIGEQSATLSGWVRNMTGYGDQFEASYQSPLGNGDSTRTALGWRMPLSARGTQLLLNVEDGASSVVEQPIQPLDVQSRLVGRDIGISQTLVETLSQKFSIGLNRVVRRNSTTLLGKPFSFVPGESSGTSKASDWRFWQEYSHHWDNQVLALRSTFTNGDNNQLDVGTAPDLTLNRQYTSWLGQAQYAHRLLDSGAQFILRLNIQDSPDRLIAMEGMSVGGINTVRGYRENQFVRDNGQVTNVELDFPIVADGANHLNLVPFFDYGRAWNNGEEKAIISSVGLATRLRWQRLAVDLAVAKRLSHSAAITSSSSNLQDQGIHLQVSYNFFGEGV